MGVEERLLVLAPEGLVVHDALRTPPHDGSISDHPLRLATAMIIITCPALRLPQAAVTAVSAHVAGGARRVQVP